MSSDSDISSLIAGTGALSFMVGGLTGLGGAIKADYTPSSLEKDILGCGWMVPLTLSPLLPKINYPESANFNDGVFSFGFNAAALGVGYALGYSAGYLAKPFLPM